MQSFNELNLSAPLMKAISELGYEKPSPIQAEALPMLLGEPTDFLGLAATGTGKTAAFSIPLLERIDPSRRAVQALILCPTRELAIQVAGQINLLGKYKGVRALPIYGGAGYGDQFRGLEQGANVVVGTPGRVVDHIDKGSLRLDQLQVLILDEADEMISMGFKDDLEAVLNEAPKESSNIWLFSATMSREVRRVADEYLVNPKQVQINRTEMLPSTVEQLYYATQESNKPEVLCKLIDAAEDFYGIVFCQTKQLVTDLTHFLTNRGYRVDCLHGDKDQNARERTMQAFRDRKVQLLICTDVASRGLDVKDITHVINYSLPRELDSYVHRIGRTARSGKTGFAMSLVTPSHRGLIARIERATKSRMKEGKIPTRKEIGIKKIGSMLNKFQEQPAHVRAVELLNDEWKTAIAEMSREEIVGRFMAMTLPEVFAEREAKEKPKASPIKPVVVVSMPVSAPIPSRSKAVEAAPADREERYGVIPAKTPAPALTLDSLEALDAPEAPMGASPIKPGVIKVGMDKPEGKAFAKKAFGQKKPYGGYGDKKPFGDRRPYGDKKPFGERKFFDKKPYGDRKPFGEGGKPEWNGKKKSFGDKPASKWGDKPLKRGGFSKGF